MFRILLAWCLTLASINASALTQGELLANKDAFQVSTETVDNQLIEVEWKIADGYYLYKDKVKWTINGADVDDVQFPMAITHNDPAFGEKEIYRNRLILELPVTVTQSPVKLDITSQGCADAGICYPPLKSSFTLDMPVAQVNNVSPLEALKGFGQSLGLQSDAPLAVEEAFKFQQTRTDERDTAQFIIAPGHYLYQERITVTTDAGPVALDLPKGKIKEDEIFGKVPVYYNSVEFALPQGLKNATLTYQGCSEAGLCYPPQKVQISTSGESTSTSNATVKLSEQDQIISTLMGDNAWLVILTFFGFGLLLSLTPCVFPMIPILSSIIVGQSENMTTRKAFTISLVYVLAMSVTYTVAGVLAGLFGENLQAAFQNPWIIGSFAFVFVLLSLSMFGFYELQLPNSIQSRLTEISNKQKSGSMIGVAIMGFLSALIVGPCVAPPLAGALIYIGQTGDALLGGSALFALSMGMGVPLLLIGAASGNILPRAGTWMEAVKAVFGVMLLGVAIWMVDRIVPAYVSMLLWAVLLIGSAIYMGALEPLQQRGWSALWKAIGWMLLLVGALQIIGVASGGRDVLQPLAHLQGSSNGINTQVNKTELFTKVKTGEQLDAAIANAKQQGKSVVIDVYADWCVSCKELDKFTFTDSSVQATLANSVNLKVDITDNTELDKALLKKYSIVGPPAILFFNPQGEEQSAQRIIGFVNAETFIKKAQKALNL